MSRILRGIFSRDHLCRSGPASRPALSGPALTPGWLSGALFIAVPLATVLGSSAALSATCGNGVVEAGEGCDVGADQDCPGGCMLNCTCGIPPAPVALAPAADTYIEKG